MTALRRLDRLALALAVAAGSAHASEQRPPELDGLIEATRPLGSAEVTLFFFDLYRADLWTPADGAFSWSQPFALSLTYKRDFSAAELADSSIQEIARVGGVDEAVHAGLEAPLRGCFADVSDGDRITGVSLGADAARFFVNARYTCDIDYPSFSRLFFGIWLDPRSRDPEAARALLGGAT